MDKKSLIKFAPILIILFLLVIIVVGLLRRNEEPEIVVTIIETEDGEIQIVQRAPADIPDLETRSEIRTALTTQELQNVRPSGAGQMPVRYDPDFVHMEGQPFPKLAINTDGNRLVLSRQIRIPATFHLSNAPEWMAFEDIRGDIRGRGNSSWDLMPKRSWNIRFDTAQTFAGSTHAARSWVLISNFADKSLLRNYAAKHFAGQLDSMYFTPFSTIVDLYKNGVYWGVYLLTDQRNLEEGRIDLYLNDDPTTSEYMLEFCMRRISQGGILGIDFIVINGNGYDIRFPSGNMATRAHGDYALQFLTNVERLLNLRDDSVFDYICLDSFVDFYIVQEWFKDQDAGFSSVFMQIRGQGDERRLEMGPVWDFDIAAGNAYYTPAHAGGYSPHGIWAGYIHRWYRQLLRMPIFYDALHARWLEIRDTIIVDTLMHVRSVAEKYQEGFERNFDRWNSMGFYVWPNPRPVWTIDTFMGQVDYLIWFLEERAFWFDEWLQNNRPR